ncbi:MAG: rod shape-determining protein RodA [Candidatus Omnitrophica bacterium]|nr:rod shape-determining protein RodA [Candidatus Omnitrophota bacterium]
MIRSRLKNFDVILFLVTILIFTIGLAFLYSATYQLAQGFLLRQLLRFAFGVLIGIVIFKIDYQKWLELAYPLYGLNLVILVLVLILGEHRMGAQRWISWGNIGFQPAEFSKLVIILVLTRYLGERPAQGRGLLSKELLLCFLLTGIPFILIVQQPDLGTALTLIPILFAVLYIWGASLKTLLLILGTGIFASPIFWHLLKDYQKRRILVFINPNMDPLGAGYTIIQSKIAIGSGGLLGKGWLSGTQSQLNFLPERHTDFIFSVVGEEWGFLGALLLLLLYGILIWRAFAIAQATSSLSGRLLAAGIIVLIAFQVIVNIAMTMGVMPVVGLPLPLISHGGSALLTFLVALAMLLNIGMNRSIL